ncbi:MAG: cztS, partial [Chloroflexi bacterium]|nr:cztS [Chloroflexota bacterium]
MSIRVRLTLWYVVLLCLGLAAFGIAVQWQVQYSASDALDSALRHRASDVVADLHTGSTLVLRQNATVLADHDLGEVSLWVRVLDAQGRVAIRQSPTVPMLSTRVLAEARPGFHDAKSAAGNHVRMYVFPVVHNGRRLATIQVITTTQQVEQGRDRLLAAMGLAGVAIVVLAAAGGLFLASRALRPVDRITRLAATIGDGDLHRRVSGEQDGPTGARRGRNDELVRLARTFDGMLARLEEASERRRRLTADVAHELNTPIATIASGAEIALRHTRRPEEYQEVLQRTLDETRHMARVVDELLLLARVEAGRLPLQHELVEIDEICRQTVK